MDSTKIKKSNYETITVDCPNCCSENIYNRQDDLKTEKAISGMNVICYSCKQIYWIYYDRINPIYEMLYFDALEFEKTKRYIICILNYCQSIETFFYYMIYNQIIKLPYQKKPDIKQFNESRKIFLEKFTDFSFNDLKNIFLNIFIKSIVIKQLTDIDNFFSNLDYLKNCPSDNDIKNHSNIIIRKNFLEIKNLKTNEIRNNIIHKEGYRPSLKEVDRCKKETYRIVFEIKREMKIKDTFTIDQKI